MQDSLLLHWRDLFALLSAVLWLSRCSRSDLHPIADAVGFALSITLFYDHSLAPMTSDRVRILDRLLLLDQFGNTLHPFMGILRAIPTL